nr:ceramide kinase isoform X1 [Ipomoea batatas]
MERCDDSLPGGNENSRPIADIDSQSSILSSNLFLDGVGEVVVTLNSDGLSCRSAESISNEDDPSLCLGLKIFRKCEISVKFCDVYAIDSLGWGLVRESSLPNASGLFSGYSFEMYRFTVHYVQKSRNHPTVWIPSQYCFGHKDLRTCQMWVNQIRATLCLQGGRPKSLLVFVNPRSGKGNGCRTWEAVAPIFSQANVMTKVTVTERPGQAFDVMASISNRELHSYDGVVTVGGDGFFNEVLNGLLLSRHKASYPPRPTESIHPVENGSNGMAHDANGNTEEPSDNNEDLSPLLTHSELDGRQGETDDPCNTDRDSFLFPNERFRFGIIPSGSTDAIVICTTGARDPITSALQIILGKSVCLDIAQVIRWKKTSTSKDEPCVRYAASFAGYGFYGDVITESEKYRWMGPVRYDFAGTKVFLRHSSYEAEVAYLEVDSKKANLGEQGGLQVSRKKPFCSLRKKPERIVCRVNCNVCNLKAGETSPRHEISETYSEEPNSEESRWLKSKGRFLSIGGAIISCRNERAPDGLVADAHLSDGFLHLILIKDCPHACYLWHLTQLAKKGGNPLDFHFVEHHKTTAFTFTSFGKESVWNIDGEPFQAHQLSAQVFRGLITMFATGPEV